MTFSEWDRPDSFGSVPARNPAHEHPQWFELDLDDEIEDPDAPFVDPLPTERHRSVPGFSE